MYEVGCRGTPLFSNSALRALYFGNALKVYNEYADGMRGYGSLRTCPAFIFFSLSRDVSPPLPRFPTPLPAGLPAPPPARPPAAAYRTFCGAIDTRFFLPLFRFFRFFLRGE